MTRTALFTSVTSLGPRWVESVVGRRPLWAPFRFGSAMPTRSDTGLLLDLGPVERNTPQVAVPVRQVIVQRLAAAVDFLPEDEVAGGHLVIDDVRGLDQHLDPLLRIELLVRRNGELVVLRVAVPHRVEALRRDEVAAEHVDLAAVDAPLEAKDGHIEVAGIGAIEQRRERHGGRLHVDADLRPRLL